MGDLHWFRMSAIPDLPEDYVLLGIDPGTLNVGVAVISTNSGYTTNLRTPTAPPLHRLADLFRQYGELIHWISRIDRPLRFVIGIELPTGRLRGNAAVRLGDIRGALIVATCLLKHKIIFLGDITPSAAKAALANDGHASKEQMMAAAMELWSSLEEGMTQDEADAIGIALAAWKRYTEEKSEPVSPELPESDG